MLTLMYRCPSCVGAAQSTQVSEIDVHGDIHSFCLPTLVQIPSSEEMMLHHPIKIQIKKPSVTSKLERKDLIETMFVKKSKLNRGEGMICVESF